jgi:hypothetical protein
VLAVSGLSRPRFSMEAFGVEIAEQADLGML